MKISARNVLSGTVAEVTHGTVSAEVRLRLEGGDEIISTMTNASARSLGIVPGTSATALVKANSVVVAIAGPHVGLSARNLLPGKVTRIKSTPVSAVLGITLAGGAMLHAVVTHEAVTDLGIQEGTDVIAAVKASSVVLAVPS